MRSQETTENPADRKVGVYICHCGGNISDHVDVDQVAKAVAELPGVSVSRTNVFMCSDPGQELIQKDIESGKVDRVVVASCAPSLHELTFRGAIKRANMNPYLYEHANIREQVSWVHDGPKATAKATALIGAAVAKAQDLTALEAIRVDAKRHVTVIGGGVAGMRAALDAAKHGLAVTLIEKSPFLGGQTAKLDKLAPTDETGQAVIAQLANALAHQKRVQVHTCSQITASEGYVGNFKLTLHSQPPDAGVDQPPGEYVPFAGFYPQRAPTQSQDFTLQTGAIIFATGFKNYAPRKGEFGFLEHTGVITLPQLIQQMAQHPSPGATLNVNGRQIRRVAFIHCVGSRQIPGIHEPDAQGRVNEYCSRTCCSAVLQAALNIRQRHPQTHVFEYYRDIRTYGRGQEDYYDNASAANVMFFRYEPDAPPVVEAAPDSRWPLRVRVTDTLTFGQELTAEVDLVVLAVGMMPGPIPELIDQMKMPVGADGFLQEVHPKLRPVEVANTGMLLAGACQAPMDVTEACCAAQAAAVKGVALLSKGYVELDPYVAQVDAQRCSGHGKCIQVCPVEGALTSVQTTVDGQPVSQARVNGALCTGCGICVAECPEHAIDIRGWTLAQYEKMVDAIAAA